MNFSGVFSALPTPFNGGEVDFTSLIRLVQHQLDNDIDGIVVMGTTAESPVLSLKQREAIFQVVDERVSSKVPIVVGTGSNSTQDTIEKSKIARNWGADALLCVVPYYNKPPQRGLLNHFSAISKAVSDIPIILYNVPSRTVTSLNLETIVELSKLGNVIGIKEASGDMKFDAQIIKSTNKKFLTLSGDDPSFFKFLETGGDGIISVVSNVIPREFSSVFKLYKEGNVKEAKTLFSKVKPLIGALNFDSNPIPIKAALNICALFKTKEVVSPLADALENDVLKLKKVMSKVLKMEFE